MPHSLFELNEMNEQQLHSIAQSLDIKVTKKMDREAIAYAILDKQAVIVSQKPAAQTAEPKPRKKPGRPRKDAASPAAENKPAAPAPAAADTDSPVNQPKKRCPSHIDGSGSVP